MIKIIYAPPDTHFRIWFPVPLRLLGESNPRETAASEVTPGLTELIRKSIIQWTEGGVWGGGGRWVQIMDYLGDTCDVSLVSEETPLRP